LLDDKATTELLKQKDRRIQTFRGCLVASSGTQDSSCGLE